MLIGICIACFCLDGSSDEEESIRALTVEDATNLIFCFFPTFKAWGLEYPKGVFKGFTRALIGFYLGLSCFVPALLEGCIGVGVCRILRVAWRVGGLST